VKRGLSIFCDGCYDRRLMEQIDIKISSKREEYRVSKWLSSTFLVTIDEFANFLNEMGEFYLFKTGEPLSSAAGYSKADFKSDYLEYLKGLETNNYKKIPALLMTYDKGDVYAFEARAGQYLLYPKYPVIQVREHHYIVTSDGRIQSGVFGKDATHWGLTFSYPQIFYDPREKKIVQVLKESNSPNTEGFKRIQKWVRDFTRPASFMINGKKVNATFRKGIK
jgi:hypothetical protein